jgi:lipopolysaccharide export system permease protein
MVLDTALGFTPKEFDVRVSISEEMKTPELRKHIEKLKIRGSDDLPFYLIEYYRRTADAFMTFILMLIGYSIASRKVRGGIGLHIVAGFALSALYIIMGQFTKTFSTNGNLPAFWGVWIPNIIFGIFAILLLRKAQQ